MLAFSKLIECIPKEERAEAGPRFTSTARNFDCYLLEPNECRNLIGRLAGIQHSISAAPASQNVKAYVSIDSRES
jgi:hypothetical protein